MNKLTLFVRCFEKCSVANNNREILAHAFICLTCGWFVEQISVFNEMKQALSPILWLFVECRKHTKVSAGSDDNVKIALIMVYICL